MMTHIPVSYTHLSMSCKAAVKGNDKLTLPEINKLIDELLSLDNPYNCPHGRPTIISMSKYEDVYKRQVRYQEKLETENYKRGNGLIPQQLFGDFCDDRLTTAYGDFSSCTK